MKNLRFLWSKAFILSLFKAGLITVGLVAFTLLGLRVATHHNRYLTVPDLKAVPFDRAQLILEEQGLRFEVLDSAKFNPEVPALSILEHIPGPGEEVKVNRKIYLTVNPSGYRAVSVPNIIQITKRNAASTLKAVGLEVGKITYRDNIGKDMVLEMRFEGAKIEPGTPLPKTSKIDLVLGNGKR
ncbi:MAG: PASTA domain-containing protein [Flavobacteriaceae bacterium]